MATVDYEQGEVDPSELPDELGWNEPKPLPPSLAEVMPFNQDLLPECFRQFVVDVADRMQCPIDFPAVAIVTVFGSLIGRQCGIRPKRQDDWMVIPNLWALVIGRPGVMKSPAIDDALKIVRRLEVEESKAYAAAMEDYGKLAEINKQRADVRKSDIKKAIKNGAHDDELLEMMDDDECDMPKRRRYLLNDSSIEKLGEILQDSPNGPLIERDEIHGWLRSLDKQGHEADRGFYLQAWNGYGRYCYDRIIRGHTVIEGTIISIIGTIQPGRLQQYVRDATKGTAGDDGLIQRFQLAVWPDCNGDWTNVDRWPDGEAKNRVYQVADQMANLKFDGAKQDDSSEVPYVRFTLDAQALFDDWRHELEARVRGDLSPAMEAHLAKYRSLIPSLALIFHLVDSSGGEVSKASLARAIEWGNYLESHANRIYGSAGGNSATVALAGKLLDRSLEDGFTKRDIGRKGWAGLDRESIDDAIEDLCELHWIQPMEAKEQQAGGRPKHAYEVNPKIYKHTETALTKLT